MKRIAAVLLALLTVVGPAQAMTVSAKVGPLLQEAQKLIVANNYKAAQAKLDEAEAVKSNPDDETVINEMRQFIQVKTLVCGPTEHSRVIGNMVEPCPKS